jgi:predicted O-methyltransferase YrrM
VTDGGGKFTALTGELHDYIVRHGSREDAALADLRERTAELGSISAMQVSPDQGALLTLLTRLTGGNRALELGTFTGYSAVCIARGLERGGSLVACELDPERAEEAKRNFAEAGVAERIEVRVGPATDTLAALRDEGGEPFDLAFIDADKESYPGYYESCLELVRAGGLIVIDNVLMSGEVLDPPPDREGSRAIAELNARIQADDRVEIAMLGVADGITLARKR